MNIHYLDGPPSVTLGAAGTFKRGEAQDIDDKLAKQILKKTSIVFKEGEPDPAASKPAGEEAQPASEEHSTKEVNTDVE